MEELKTLLLVDGIVSLKVAKLLKKHELLVTKNIKESYVNDMCIDINTNTI